MLETEIEEDRLRRAWIGDREGDAGDDLQVAGKVVRPADARADGGRRGVPDPIRGAIPERFDEDVETMIGEPDKALAGGDHVLMSRGLNRRAEVPVRHERR